MCHAELDEICQSVHSNTWISKIFLSRCTFAGRRAEPLEVAALQARVERLEGAAGRAAEAPGTAVRSEAARGPIISNLAADFFV